MSDKKRIALITTWFPPQMSVATNRMLAFVEFLSGEYEIEVFCLDAKNDSNQWSENVLVHYTPSSRILEKLKSKQTDNPLVHKIRTALKVMVSKVITNPLIKWKTNTLTKLVAAHQKNPFDILISSYAPQEAHLVALEFCKKFNDIPWIADMRDEMSKNPGLNPQQQSQLHEIEKEINKYASAITSVSAPILNDFKTLCPDVSEFEEIRNGYNHSFVRDKALAKNTHFTLGYFGTFYGSRKPYVLMEALRQLKNEDQEFDFVFEIYGAHHNFTIPSELRKNVVMKQGLPYKDAIVQMSKMDLNIQIHPRSEQKGVYTGKLFDYISVQQPVLGLVDKEDVAADLIREFDCGYIAEFSDLEENKSMIRLAFENWKKNEIKFATDEQAQSLHRKKQVEKLSSLIQKLLKK